MNRVSIYVDREDITKVEAEERDRFIKGVIESIGIKLDDIWPGDQLETTEQKVKFRDLMLKYDVDILNDGDVVKICHEEDVIAEWFKPRYILRTDPSAKQPSKRVFFEMQLKFWSMFDEQGDTND